MQRSYNVCFHCQNPFDKTLKIPRFLPDCGHSLCNQCLLDLLQHNTPYCPLCLKPFLSFDKAYFPTNLQLLVPNTPLSTPKDPICLQHKRVLEAFCQLDRKPVCLSCIMENQHRFHEVIPIKDAYKHEKQRILEFLYETKGLEEKLEGINLELLEKSKDSLIKDYESSIERIRGFFNRIHGILNEKQGEIEGLILSEYRKKEKAFISQENNIQRALTLIDSFKEEYEGVKREKDFEILSWSIEKEPLKEEVRNEAKKDYKAFKEGFLIGVLKKGLLERITKELGEFIKEEGGKLIGLKGFIGRVKIKGKENWEDHCLRTIENQSSKSGIKSRNDETSFLIEEQRKFHLKMATFT